MEWIGTVAAIIILTAIIAGIIVGIIKDRKKGKSVCGCDCSNCHCCH